MFSRAPQGRKATEEVLALCTGGWGGKHLPSITTRTLHRRQQHNERGRRLLLSLLLDYYTTLTFLRVVAYVDDSVRKYSSSTLSLTAASQSAIGHATQSDPLPLSLTPSPSSSSNEASNKNDGRGRRDALLPPATSHYVHSCSELERAREGQGRVRPQKEEGC